MRNIKTAMNHSLLPHFLLKAALTLSFMMLFFLQINAQGIRVTGQVLNETAAPLAGVSVAVKGSTTGTTTDAEGNYAITVPNNNSVLVFSYVGYTLQEVRVGTQTNVTIVLQSAATTSLSEVVVIGYGTQRKRDLTGSIGSVSGEEVARMPATNPISSLQGKVAGLTISNSGRAGSSPVVRIRGINSTNTASPVYVVDGILQDNIDYLNPADIESIDILKDPSSIAIYGMRAANGVIAVTLKKAARGKTIINLQSSVGIQTVQDRISVVDAAGFRKLYDAQLANINANPFDYTNYTGNTNWQDLALRDALITTNNLSFSNSGDKTTTYLSVGYTNQEGVLRNDQFERFIIRLNQDIKFNDHIKVGGDITGYHSNRNPPSVSITNALWAAPIVPVQLDENTYYSMPSFQRAQVGNPMANLNRNDRTSINKGYRVIGSLFAEIKFLRNFTARSVIYGDFGFNNSRGYSALPFTFINLGEGAAPTTTTFDNTVRTSVSQSQSENRRFQQDHTLTFDKRLGDGHSVTALAGFTTVYNYSSSISGNRRDFEVNIPNNPNFWYLDVSNNSNPGNFGGGGGESSLVGAFGRVNYAYQGKYLVNATIRRDGTSKFAPENRYGTFGSIGLGWVVSDENFFNNIKGIDFLKLRGAWGKIGNSNGAPDNLFQPGISNAATAVFGDNIYTSIQAAFIPDPNLHFEVIEGIDVGVELKTFNRRLSTEINLYNRTTSDILTRIAIPNDSREKFTNLGEITNKGIEVTAGWQDRLSTDFTYNVSANFSYNKNVVNAIGDNVNFQIIRGPNLTETGQSIGYFFGYRQTGIYQSVADLDKQPAFINSLPGDISFEDVNGDGVITTADRTYLGTPFPPYNYGGSINLGYKGFDILIEGQGSAGNKIYTQRRTSNFATLNYESNRLNAWTGPGSTNIEPILDATRGNNFLFSSYFLEPGDYFRLRTVQIGYTFTQDFLNKIRIQTARVYLNGQNIKNWSQVTGYSPEPLIGSILQGGADNGAYPVPAIYSFGLNITFN
ncbi:MAG: SusC/RagA family TonB-linked outer membrane protein [Chitinophagaceae bacterium]